MSRHLAAVAERPARVVLYVRVSALMGRGGDDFHSPDVQLAAMRRATAGMREVAVIDDDIDVSGRSFTRDGIARIRELAESGRIDALAVYNLSRFGRNVLESLQFLNWLADRGVTVLSATESVDTSTPSGRWMLTTMLGIAEMRSDEIGVEWSNAIAARARAGKHHGRPPTGYVRGDDGRLVPHPILGPAISAAFGDYAEDAGVRAIRRRIQAAAGLALATSTLKRLLANRTYLGIVHVGPRGAGVEVPGAHPPLVDDVTWRRVQDRMARDRRIPAKLLAPKYALSGIGRCGVCEGPTNHRPEGRTATVRIFCRRQWEMVSPCPGCGRAAAHAVEDAVLDRVREHIALLRGDVGAQAAVLARATRAGIDAGSVRTELDATRRAMARATERWAREQMNDRTYEDTMAGLRAAEERLAETLRGLQRTVDAPKPGELVALGEKLLKLWPSMDGTQRNRALRDLVETVTIRPATRYRQPVSERIDVRFR